MKYRLSLLILTCLLAGCADKPSEGLLKSLDQRYEYEQVNAGNGPLYKAISLTGLLPTQKLGIPYYFNAQEGIDASFEFGGERTLYTSQVIGDTITAADVQAVAQKVLEVKRMSNNALQAKINLIKAQKGKDSALIAQCLTLFQNAEKELNIAQRAAIAALKPGIIILQWGNKYNDQDSFGLNAGNSYHYKYNDNFRGILVLGGIKVSRLSTIGKDFCSRIAAMARHNECRPFKNNMVIPTYLLQARHLIFMDQVSDLAKDDLSIALDKAIEANALTILEKVELESIHKQAYSLFGLGEISGLRTIIEPGYVTISDTNPWVTVYAIMPSVENLHAKLKGFCP